MWNNLLQPPGKKSRNWSAPQKRFLCPTKQFPYFYTNTNGNAIQLDDPTSKLSNAGWFGAILG